MAIGVLALQGGYDAHARALRTLGHEVRLVRYAADLNDLAGLVFPGGESTTTRQHGPGRYGPQSRRPDGTPRPASNHSGRTAAGPACSNRQTAA